MNNQIVLFKAIEFANWAHRNQKRKLTDEPYIVHPFHVMLLLLNHNITEETPEGLTILVSGALHDTIEDNPEEVNFSLIVEKFGSDVAKTVNGVTLDPNNPDKYLSRKKILKSDWKIRIVKIADILSNTIAMTELINQNGVAKVQKCFKQPIAERIQMERNFLQSVIRPDDWCDSMLIIRRSTFKALDELENALKKQ